MSLHRRNEPWLRMSRFRRKSLVKNLAAEVLEPRYLLTDATGIVAVDESVPGEANVSSNDSDEPPLPENYANEELWFRDYTQWMIDKGYWSIDSDTVEAVSEAPSNSDEGIASPDARNESPEVPLITDPSGSGTDTADESISSVIDWQPPEPPLPENYANEELWFQDYVQWMIDHGYCSIDSDTVEAVSEAPSNSDEGIASPDAGNESPEVPLITDPSGNGTDIAVESISSVIDSQPPEPPLPENYANEELWFQDYVQWMIDHGYSDTVEAVSGVLCGEGSDQFDSSVVDGGNHSLSVSADDVQLIGQGIATDGIEDRELAEFDTARSDSAFGELADSEPEAGDALAANGDTNSADVSEQLELDAALSDALLGSLTEPLPTDANL